MLERDNERLREMKLPVTTWVPGGGCRVAGMQAQVSLRTDFILVRKLI